MIKKNLVKDTMAAAIVALGLAMSTTTTVSAATFNADVYAEENPAIAEIVGSSVEVLSLHYDTYGGDETLLAERDSMEAYINSMFNNASLNVEVGGSASKEVPNSYTGLAYSEELGWYYAVNGVADFNASGIIYYENAWYFVKNGLVDFTYTGLAYDVNVGWWYIENGVVNSSYNGLGCNPENGSWWKVTNGSVDFGYTALAYDAKVGWWYVKNGAVDFSKNGLGCNLDNGSWWKVTNGAVDFSFTGLAFDSEVGWWYVKDGSVDFTKNGLGCNPENGSWWKVTNGAVDFSYTGNVTDEAVGTWYVENGAVIRSADNTGSGDNGNASTGFTGFKTAEDGTMYYYSNGVVDVEGTSEETGAWGLASAAPYETPETSENNSNWTLLYHDAHGLKFNGGAVKTDENGVNWYVKNGVVNPVLATYTNYYGETSSHSKGVVYSNNTWWYVEDGKATEVVGEADWNGLHKYANGIIFYFKDGKVDTSFTDFYKFIPDKSSLKGTDRADELIDMRWFYCVNGLWDYSFTGWTDSPNGLTKLRVYDGSIQATKEDGGACGETTNWYFQSVVIGDNVYFYRIPGGAIATHVVPKSECVNTDSEYSAYVPGIMAIVEGNGGKPSFLTKRDSKNIAWADGTTELCSCSKCENSGLTPGSGSRYERWLLGYWAGLYTQEEVEVLVEDMMRGRFDDPLDGVDLKFMGTLADLSWCIDSTGYEMKVDVENDTLTTSGTWSIKKGGLEWTPWKDGVQ